MEEKKELELRMYFFVPYNISPIQQAIQAGHAAQQYDLRYRDEPQLIEFINNHKTWIILNGGTTNWDSNSPGTLNEIYTSILDYNAMKAYGDFIDVEKFMEPDLNNALTAVCFICDERVFNYEDYPDIERFCKIRMERILFMELFKNGPVSYEQVEDVIPELYGKWVNTLGGKKNVFLRELLKGKKLA